VWTRVVSWLKIYRFKLDETATFGQLYRNMSQAENKDEILRGFKDFVPFFTPLCLVMPIFAQFCTKRQFSLNSSVYNAISAFSNDNH